VTCLGFMVASPSVFIADAERLHSPARNQQAKRRWVSVRCKAWFGVTFDRRSVT
jgi:hypothetical protein